MGNFHQCKWCGGGLRFISNVGVADAESVTHENLIAYCASQAMKDAGVGRVVSGGIKITARFYLPIAETRKCKKHVDAIPGTLFSVTGGCKKLHSGEYHYQRPDLDNLIKSLDGINGVVFSDDCLVAEIHTSKVWSDNPRSEITVETI